MATMRSMNPAFAEQRAKPPRDVLQFVIEGVRVQILVDVAH
jgi:hypothetical protein